jgi:hypothetical protein
VGASVFTYVADNDVYYVIVTNAYCTALPTPFTTNSFGTYFDINVT